jgi:hypothetical protein
MRARWPKGARFHAGCRRELDFAEFNGIVSSMRFELAQLSIPSTAYAQVAGVCPRALLGDAGKAGAIA